MVYFVQKDSYMSAYNAIRHQYRETWRPIQVFCSASVDSCASWCILQECLQEDLILFEVHVVSMEGDIREALETQEVFAGDTKGLQIIFLNCGVTQNFFSAIESDHPVTVHVLDSHGPVSLELLASPKASNLYIWDTGNTQANIERFFTDIVNNRDRAKSKKRQRGDAQAVEDAYMTEESISSGESSDEAVEEKGILERYTTLSLTDAEKTLYASMEHASTSPSTFLFQVLTQLRVKVSDTIVWYRAVALTAFHFDNLLHSADYAESIAKLYAVVGVNHQHKARYRTVNAPDNLNPDASDRGLVGSYHTVRIETNLDTPLILLHHWTLWDALRHSPFVAERLKLFEGKSVSQQRILDVFAHLGITQKESIARWTELQAVRREEIQRLLLTENIINSEPLIASFRSISKRHGYGFICGSTDMVRLMQCVLSRSESGDRKDHIEKTTAPNSHRARFFSAVEALQSASMSLIAQEMGLCCRFYAEIVETAAGIHQKSLIKSTKTFAYVLLQDEDFPEYYLHPSTLNILAQYVVHLPRSRKPTKNRDQIFFVGALDRQNDSFIVLGLRVVKSERSDSSKDRMRGIAPLFQKLATDYPEVVTYAGVDKDWISIKREHCLHILDAIHIHLRGISSAPKR